MFRQNGEDIKIVFHKEISEKSHLPIIQDWAEMLQNQDEGKTDPQKFGDIRYVKF